MTMDLGTNKTYCFLKISETVPGGVDQVTSLSIHTIGTGRLIGLPALQKKKQWMVSITRQDSRFSIGPHATKAQPGQEFLHVDWDSSFLL